MQSFTTEQIKEISQQLDCGFRAFYHKLTGELIFVPDTDRHFDMDTSAWKEELKRLKKNFLNYQEIYAMEASDSFKVMAEFSEQITDERLRAKLIDALERKGPFTHFKFVIDNAGDYRQHWFAFKGNSYYEWVVDQLKMHNQLNDQENVSQ
ncbi:UPF0158 family protein [Ferruginibacter paludis]|uniref:UPF0158 family protein n=1 Tax=Ferruginibacter paludis TaxID=1310417 RepID=UPI0025B4105E|nr:UPF0158 family protein [Ferruginibacter paludis]MDN3657066.1 UPF0158 family protein [Ferruginibacter paludis]